MKVDSGSSLINDLLEGGWERNILNTIYGPAGSGKTLLCLMTLIEVVKKGGKVVYIDTEGGFSVERLKQLTPIYEEILGQVVFLKPVSFEEQKEAFEKLRGLVNEKIGLVVVDTVSMLYRLEMGKSEDVYEINKALGQQLGYLSEIARVQKIPVLIINQVYADFENPGKVKIVGGDLLKYGSKCMLELQNGLNGVRVANLRKHRSIKPSEVSFKIVEKGLEKV